jgi:hypothetical protein
MGKISQTLNKSPSWNPAPLGNFSNECFHTLLCELFQPLRITAHNTRLFDTDTETERGPNMCSRVTAAPMATVIPNQPG